MSSMPINLPMNGGSYHYAISNHYSVQPHQDHSQYNHLVEPSVVNRAGVLPPAKLNISRPFSNQLPMSHQYHPTGSQAVPRDDRTFVAGVIETAPSSPNNSVRRENVTSTINDNLTYTATRASKIGAGREGDKQKALNAQQIVASKETSKDLHLHFEKEAADKCLAAADGVRTSRHEDRTSEKRRQNLPQNVQPSSTSAPNLTPSGDGSTAKVEPKIVDKPNRVERDSPKQQETVCEPSNVSATHQPSDHIAATTVAKAGAKTVRTNPAASMRKATQQIGSFMKRTSQDVIMEDDNIVVRVDSFNVVYKDTNKLFCSLQTEIKALLDRTKKEIANMCETKLKAFEANLDRHVKTKTNRQRQATPKSISKPEDAHGFVLFTLKPESNMFHMATAADRRDVEKKSSKIRNVHMLLLEFFDTERFGVRVMRDLFKESGMSTKAKNVFSYSGEGLIALQSYLIDIFTKKGVVGDKLYRITSLNGERSQSSVKTPASRKRTPLKKKDIVRRSHNEDFTDGSSDDEPQANERVEDNEEDTPAEYEDEPENVIDLRNGYNSDNENFELVRDAYEDAYREQEGVKFENDYNIRGRTGIKADENGFSELEDGNDETTTSPKAERGRKRSRTITESYDRYSDRECDSRNHPRSSKKKRSRRDH